MSRSKVTNPSECRHNESSQTNLEPQGKNDRYKPNDLSSHPLPEVTLAG
jgi:hypothetical protein